MQKKEKYETCRHAETVGDIAVYVKPTCPRLLMIKGTLRSSKIAVGSARAGRRENDRRNHSNGNWRTDRSFRRDRLGVECRKQGKR